MLVAHLRVVQQYSPHVDKAWVFSTEGVAENLDGPPRQCVEHALDLSRPMRCLDGTGVDISCDRVNGLAFQPCNHGPV